MHALNWNHKRKESYMELTVKDLKAGISYWKTEKKDIWPKDFHNKAYAELYALRENGLTIDWWKGTVDRLWMWRAIRPKTKNDIMLKGKKDLNKLQNYFYEIQSKVEGEPCFADFEWNQLEDLYNHLSSIKETKKRSPVFPSKLGHFIFPKLFIVMDRAATGIKAYDEYWISLKDAWNKFEQKDTAKNMLNKEICRKPSVPLTLNYPLEIKIIELCSIGSKLRGS